MLRYQSTRLQENASLNDTTQTSSLSPGQYYPASLDWVSRTLSGHSGRVTSAHLSAHTKCLSMKIFTAPSLRSFLHPSAMLSPSPQRGIRLDERLMELKRYVRRHTGALCNLPRDSPAKFSDNLAVFPRH